MHKSRPTLRIGAALALGALLFPIVALASTIATQDDQSVQSGTFFSNAIQQNLGNALGATTLKSVAIKLGTASDATDFNSGNWYGLVMHLCNFDYSVCNNPVGTTFSGVFNAGIATFLFNNPVTLQANNYYSARIFLRQGDTVFGSASATALGGGSFQQQCGPVGCATPPTDGRDPNIKDMAIRLCDSDVCDFTPPDTQAPGLDIITASASSSLPTITGTTDDTADVALILNDKTYTTTPSAGAWSVTLPSGDELADNTYAITASSTDATSNTGTATGNLLVDTTPPALSIDSGP